MGSTDGIDIDESLKLLEDRWPGAFSWCHELAADRLELGVDAKGEALRAIAEAVAERYGGAITVEYGEAASIDVDDPPHGGSAS